MAKRHLPKALLVIVVALSPLVALFVRADSPIATKPIYTPYRTFRIPFRLDPTEADRLKAIELHVSRDHGKTWQRSHSAVPSARNFTYRCESDGEYWFGVRTLDRSGKAQPADDSDLTPSLKVIVDSQVPKIALRSKSLKPGWVAVDWRVTDANADLNSLKIEYRQPDTRTWKTLRTQPKRTGHVRWPIKSDGLVQFRAHVSDLAGNKAETKTQVRVASAAPAKRPKTNPTRRPNPKLVAGGTSKVRSNRPISLEDRFEDRIKKPTFNLDPSNEPEETAREEPKPPIAEETDFSDTTTLPQAESRGIQAVNTRTFTIDYQLDDIGPSGVSSIDLWITADGGKSWKRYGEDGDRKSPFLVGVPQDGLYGFALVVKSGVDLGHEPPRAGDPPQMQVLVDTTPPQARLLEAQPGKGEKADRVEIRWQAGDIGFVETPIALYYAEKPTGQWKPVATRLQNKGSYSWKVGRTVPDRVFLRLVVRDRAGNVQVVDSSQPVTIDRSRPQGRLLGVARNEKNSVRRN